MGIRASGAFGRAVSPWWRLTRAGGLAACLTLALCASAGCGSGTTDGAGGASDVVTLGPRPVGGAPGGGDQAAQDGTSANGANPTDNEHAEPSDNGAAGSVSDPVDGSAPGTGGDTLGKCSDVFGPAFLNGGDSLSFVDSSFIWVIGGADFQGTVECVNLNLTGTTAAGEVFTGNYDALNDLVIWQGSVYRRAVIPRD